jgi:hypothetical protein
MTGAILFTASTSVASATNSVWFGATPKILLARMSKVE